MKKLTETKLLDLMRDLSTETEPRLKQIYDKLQEAMACESNVVNIGKVDLYSLASNDKLRPALHGVLHQEGNRIVCDGVILAVLKSEYPSEHEGKIIAKDGSVIEGRYPNYKSVIPADISQWLSYPIDYARVVQLEKDFRVYKKVNGKNIAEEYNLKFGEFYMRVGYFLQFCKLLKEYDIDCVKISDARKMMIVKTGSMTALLMLCNKVSEDEEEDFVDWSDVEPCEDTDNQFEDFEL